MSEKLKGWALVRAAMRDRKTAAMLVLGFASGLPFVLLIGTLNAWLGELKVSLATIGVLSWIGLAYAFKFLWSPVVDRVRLPLLGSLGRRRSWLVLCQGGLAVLLWMLAATDPLAAIGSFAMLAVLAAFLSATQDVVIDAWRIEVADETATVELLSAIYQLGNRFAALAGGALALVLAARISWPAVYVGFGFVMLAAIAMTLFTPEAQRDPAERLSPLAGHAVPEPSKRAVALGIVAICWAWAIFLLGSFMVEALRPVAPGATAPSSGVFTQTWGPWIIVATVIVPALIAAWTNRLPHHAGESEPSPRGAHAFANHTYRALILPLAEIVGRLRWGALLVLSLILLYRIADSIWAPFAFPFYLGELQYTNDEVAFASKLFGVVMTIAGVGIGGLLLATLGRMPTLLAGGIVAAVSNLLYADLALGGANIDAFSHLFFLDRIGVEPRMMRLMVAISGENIAGGLAGTAFVAYISSITSREYSAVQYALLSSMTFLVGALGRAATGEAIERYGYADIFFLTAGLGAVAVVLVLAEWWRSAWAERRLSGGQRVPA
ncbi:AmpG family muropeptide MFS transporter [Sphingomonas xinjiangensis]|uniref:PAT family beta-lactamase induction signal transducer AmpG n=1 Tax=Sphingomonas xinjiangensis TaxID=643568 RepID=A0A840YNA8_9SPHN|nr:MFS transporter [Sphingomonas xinjiangensis]MBB5709261.1 PAT family beta-lactamase induction signal transducer AmpG [Sphingomonas xinjiangensis]